MPNFLFFKKKLILIFILDFIEESWTDFKKDCQSDKNSELNCLKYKYADIMWNGYVIRIDYNDNFFARFRLTVLVKMEKTDTEDPEIQLKFTDYQYEQFKGEIFNITRGDSIHFNATIIQTGDSNSVPVLEAFGFEKLNEHIYIQPHIHHNTRYSVGHGDKIEKDGAVFKELQNLVSDNEVMVDQEETFH
jgi:hypothetical protein